MKILHQKNTRFIISGIIAILIYFIFIHPLVKTFIYDFEIIKDDPKRYLWWLNDSVKLDDRFGHPEFLSVTGRVRDGEEYFNFNLEGGTYVHI